MADGQKFLNQINSIKDACPLSITLSSVNQAKLAKKDIVNAQKQMRQVKSEVLLEIKSIRNAYSESHSNVGAGGAALFSAFGKKGIGKSYQAKQKRAHNQERDKAIAPYEQLKVLIDKYLLAYDELKLKIDKYIEQTKSQAAP